MRSRRHLFGAATLGILVAATPTLSQASSETHTTHPHQSASCSTCHMGTRAEAGPEHRVDVCLTCHDQSAPLESSLGPWGPDGLVDQLGSIGTASSSAAVGVAGVGATAEDGSSPRRDDHGSRCTRCHSFHEPTSIVFVDREANISNPKVANHCATCHSHSDETRLGRLTEGHKAAAVLYHWMGSDLAEYSLSDACLLCHDQSKGLPTNLPAFLPVTPRFDTHASHPYGVRMAGTGDFFRPVIDSRIRLFDDQIECQTCHDLSAQNEDLIVVFETKYEMCRGCHTQGLPQGQFQDGLVQR